MTDIQQRIKQSALATLDILDDVLRKLAPPPAANRPPLIVVSRQLANMLGVWHFCAEITCRRARPARPRSAILPTRPGGQRQRGGVTKSRRKQNGGSPWRRRLQGLYEGRPPPG